MTARLSPQALGEVSGRGLVEQVQRLPRTPPYQWWRRNDEYAQAIAG